MERQAVKSSSIKSIGYNEASQTLEVEFANGGVYQHSGVGPETYQTLITAPSIGKAYQQLIRGLYPHRKVESEPAVHA